MDRLVLDISSVRCAIDINMCKPLNITRCCRHKGSMEVDS